MIAEFDCSNFSMHRLELTEEEIRFAGIRIPVSSVRDVVVFPIAGNMRGLGGCLKFVTEENPGLPVRNVQRGWDIEYRGEVLTGPDLARGNCFWYGGDYSANGWTEQNAKAEEIAAAVRSLLTPREEPAPVCDPGPAEPQEPGAEEGNGEPKKKLSFFEKIKNRKR